MVFSDDLKQRIILRTKANGNEPFIESGRFKSECGGYLQFPSKI